MKIALAIYSFNPTKGGAERYAYDLATYLLRKGHDVYVFCCGGISIPAIKTIKFHTLPYPRWLRTLTFALRHRKLIRYFPFDIVLGFGNVLDCNVFQSHGGVQKIWMEREIESYDDASERRRKAFLLRSSINQKMQEYIAEYAPRMNRRLRVIAISDMVRDHMAEAYKMKAEEIDIVYNGVDTDRFHPSTDPVPGDLRVIFSAGNFRLKGLSPLIEALGNIGTKRRDFHLSVMGRGQKNRYIPLIKEKGLDDLVTFIGETPSPQTFYQKNHILAHPTFYDACSLTTMESMASGLPTISTRWNGSSAFIADNAGFVIDEPRNIAALTDALTTLFDPRLRSEMGKNARSAIERYTMERNARQMERIFREVCDGKYTA